MAPGKFQGCTKGIFGLQSWAPLRKAGDSGVSASSVPKQDALPVERKPAALPAVGKPAPARGQTLIAIHNYTANPSSPLGVNSELSIKQKERLVMIQPHDVHNCWWLVSNAAGDRGYAPENFLMAIEEKLTGLPWLQNKAPEEILPPVDTTATYKPYRSAYDKASDEAAKVEKKQWYCEVCHKDLNGPQPYSAHMKSRSHRDELESQMAYQQS